MARKYFIETYGCQMNVHDSERMAGLLDQAGYEPTTQETDADLVVINTCSVRERAEEKLYTRLGELKALRDSDHGPVIAVTGCVAQQEGAALLRKSNGRLIDVVLGTQRLKMLPALVEQASRQRNASVDINPWDDVAFPLGITRRGDPVKAYVTITEGCNDHCAFCVVPYTRGHERMRTRADILADVSDAAASGRKEIHLLGQIVNHYQAPDDASCDFASLLEAVHEVSGVERIRFASPHPRHASDRLIAAVRDLPKVCKHVHLPVQSGSTRVLTAMRRRHSREEYLDLLGRFRDAIPSVTLSTDMIVGFPGETAADFEQTLSLVQSARYHSMFSFKYSVRPNTLASKRLPDDVSEIEKTTRITMLQALQKEIQTQLLAESVGTIMAVLVDTVGRRRGGELAGRSHGNTVVSFPMPGDGAAIDANQWLGRTQRVRITRSGPYSLWGESSGDH